MESEQLMSMLNEWTPRKRVVCADGYSLSVQAYSGAYCLPRVGRAKAYTHVEVGFIEDSQHNTARTPRGWSEYKDGSVYGYVPAAKVQSFIEKHGGMVDGELPPLELQR